MIQQISHPLSRSSLQTGSSGAGPVGILFNDVFATHRENIERKVTNLVAKMTKSADMTRLQLADNEPFKLDAAKFTRWCADGSCAEIVHQPFLVAISPMTLAWGANFYPRPGLGASLVALRGSFSVRFLHMDTVRSWGNKDLASLLTFFDQLELQKNWANDPKDAILKPNEAIWFLYGYLPLITALPCEGEKSVQKAAVSLLLPTYSKLGLNSLTATNKTDIGNYIKSVFVHYAGKAKTWKDLQTPISQFLSIVLAGLNNLSNTL